MVYTPKQLNDFDIVSDLREFAKLAERQAAKKDIKLSKKVTLQKLAKLARIEANRMMDEFVVDKAA